MVQSAFIEYIQKWFPGIVVRMVETTNDSKNPITYLHKTMLRKDYSVDGKWASVNVANTLVAADVVAMDSSLPLKKRDSITKATGDIPKMGMELKLNEKQLTDLDTLVAQGATEQQIIAKLFQDVPKVIGGVYERNEAMFLEGLSTGVTLVEDAENVGTGVRLDFGYRVANKFGVGVLWSDPTNAKPFDDIQKVIDKANLDGNTISSVLLDRATFNRLAASAQAKELFAFSQGFVGNKIPAPDLSQMNVFTNNRYGFTFQIVDRSIRVERNGIPSTYKPWADGAVVFLTSNVVGSLVWARLAEQNHPVAGVEYQTADDYILVSKYRKNEPSISEHTKSQARVVPVISNVDQIYVLDSKTVQA